MNKQVDYVTVVHHYKAAPTAVFDAFLDPKIASKFLFATPTGEMVKAEIDAKVGGKFTFVDRRAGEDILHTGEYLEIKRPHRLAFTFSVPQYSSESTTVEIDIFDVNDGSEVTLKHSGVLEEYREKTRDGWAKILRGLADIVEI